MVGYAQGVGVTFTPTTTVTVYTYVLVMGEMVRTITLFLFGGATNAISYPSTIQTVI